MNSTGGIWKGSLRIVKRLTIIGCFGYTLDQHIASPWVLDGSSMEPTLQHYQLVVTFPWMTSLSRSNIVIIKNPFSPQERICKRVIGKYANVDLGTLDRVQTNDYFSFARRHHQLSKTRHSHTRGAILAGRRQ